MREMGTAASGVRFRVSPQGPFSLAAANERFGGWVEAQAGEELAVSMAFPVEGSWLPAAVVVRQSADGAVAGEVHSAGAAVADAARRQALAVLSLDVDGSGFSAVGEADPVIGDLQARYPGLRPVLFHSPYEAAAAFVIGHRISIAQGRAIRKRIAAALGAGIETPAGAVHAFPAPADLLRFDVLPGVPAAKIERLHGVAQAALDGLLDRDRLRTMPEAEALSALRQIGGIGPFFAQGILMRGAGLVDAVTDDEVSMQALQRAYRLPGLPTHENVTEITDRWRPYRMWALVLLHAWFRSEAGGPLRHRR
ncbi:MAG: DNA-3-methyladenine glycosylase 2 family protein [Candidatus Dormibacteraeota bacterium]|nr:DNA-3-methyladenine glycosylase 2 family protein [Candidatus Dormibacteraeota bacterium]